MTQTWRNLLFAHWPVQASALNPLLPPGLTLEQHSGSAWLAVVPFRMTGIRPRGLPVVPVLSETLELNVRTYVSHKGVPGVYFFSLDAASRLAVRIARRFFHLPYFDAEMECSQAGELFDYHSARRGSEAAVHVRYRPTGSAVKSLPGTLEYFLTERYALYTTDPRGTLLRGAIHHEPWPLQPAEAEFESNTVTEPLGLVIAGKPLLHFSRELDVKILGLSAC